jgi:glycine cleavage system H protein
MKYTKTHEWVREEEGLVVVGLSEHAQGELGDIVYVDLPDEGTEIAAGDVVVVLESTKAAADVYSPVSGKVVAVNDALTESSGLVNDSAESEGWLYKIELADKTELDGLMGVEEYKQFIG